jgi:hypothetical protein
LGGFPPFFGPRNPLSRKNRGRWDVLDGIFSDCVIVLTRASPASLIKIRSLFLYDNSKLLKAQAFYLH